MSLTVQEIDDHAVTVEFDPEADRFYFTVEHPPTCFCIHYVEPKQKFLRDRDYPRCPIHYEHVNVGLNEENFDPEVEWPVDLFKQHAESGEPLPIEVYVSYGWSESTWIAPAEYEWEFYWKPKEAR